METFTVQAVYQKGVLKPKAKLNLPEDSVVELQVKMSVSRRNKKTSLFGAFPELAVITDEDIHQAKKRWERGLKKQARMLKKGK